MFNQHSINLLPVKSEKLIQFEPDDSIPSPATRSVCKNKGFKVSQPQLQQQQHSNLDQQRNLYQKSHSKPYSLSCDFGIGIPRKEVSIQDVRFISECYQRLWKNQQQQLLLHDKPNAVQNNRFGKEHSSESSIIEEEDSHKTGSPSPEKKLDFDEIKIKSEVQVKGKKEIATSEVAYTYKPDWSQFENVFAEDLPVNDESVSKSLSFLSEIVDLLLDYIHRMRDRNTKVLDFHHPHQLKEALGHCLDLPKDPKDLEQVLSDCKETLKYGVKTGHPRFFNQISTGLDVIAVAGEWLSAVANTNMFTYEIAPVFTLMEEVTLQHMRSFVGWSEGDGIFAPGGAIANLYAMLAARHAICPKIKHDGMASIGDVVVFTSQQAHFSIKKGATIVGLGSKRVITIPCDDRGKMSVPHLEEAIVNAIENGKKVMMVSCTGGTTVLGAFDPIEEIANLCEKYGIWMHVDCAWGGGALLTQDHRHLVKGIERANSVTWNPHKAMGISLQCSAILVRDTNILKACNSTGADYLFQPDKHYDTSYDTGDKAIQCGRHNDVFKLWLVWRAKGDEGFENMVSKMFYLTKHLLTLLEGREGFEMVLEKPEYLNVCFWYVPKNMRHLPKSHERDLQLHLVAPKIKAKMMEAGTIMVAYQPLGTLPNFFRVIISNPAIEVSDLQFLVDEIAKLGEED